VSAYVTAKQQAISELTAAGDTNIFFRDDSAGFNPAIHTVDGLHPNATGLALLATNREGLTPYRTIPPTVARRRPGSGRTGTRTAIYG
jgi:hypothetical protein